MEKNLGCIRAKTVRDYIYDLGKTELAHDYEAEVKRIIAMLDEQDRATQNAHYKQISWLEAKIEDLETINSCLVKCVRELGERKE